MSQKNFMNTEIISDEQDKKQTWEQDCFCFIMAIFMDEDILILSVKHILKYIFMIDYDIKIIFFDDTLTHCGLVTSYGDIDMGQHWLR